MLSSYSASSDGSFLIHFANKKNIERLIHLDTDILSFGDFSEIEIELKPEESATCGMSPHVALMSHQAIKDMARLILSFFGANFNSRPKQIIPT